MSDPTHAGDAEFGRRMLVAGIGNIFLGDDGFGVEVARRLASRPQLDGVEIADFGIRGWDLAYALMDGYDAVVLVDALPLGKAPGAVTLLEPDVANLSALGAINSHALNPVAVLSHVKQLGGELPKVLIVGCEPFDLGEEEVGRMGLSDVVAAAVGPAVDMVESVTARLFAYQEAT